MRFLSRALVASALILGSTAAAVAPASAGQKHQDDDRGTTVPRVPTAPGVPQGAGARRARPPYGRCGSSHE